MHRFSQPEKRMLKLMIVDCDCHHMTEKESLYYISKQFGRGISRRTYYNYKNIIYQGKKRKIRFMPKWIRGLHLTNLLVDMQRCPLGSDFLNRVAIQ
jgi:hypothetical protein